MRPQGARLSREFVERLSWEKGEPAWMREHRLRCLAIFEKLPMPRFGPDLSALDLADLTYYARPVEPVRSWEELPEELRRTFQALGLPEAEQRALAGLGAQVDSEEVYRSLLAELRAKGVVFTSMERAVREFPEVREYFMRVIPPEDNKFAALHGAVWSGGTFIWVPEGVEVEIPLQAYYRMQTEGVGQFEHTLILAEPGSSLHYIEGCSAPRYSRASLHSGMVEIVAKEGARVRFTTIQNWSRNVYNLNNKRAWAYAGARVDWVSGSLGSRVTMLYPTTVLLGKGAATENLSFTFAQEGMWLDTGARAIHRAPDTSSRLVARSVVQGRATSVFRGTIHVAPEARGAKAHMECSTLLLSPEARTETIPVVRAETDEVELGHEATVGRVSQEQLFYLRSRGLDEAQALSLIVNGFVSPILKEIPWEYALELRRLLEMSFEKAVA
ncbi:MAG: Fe-S cluster assembly protein SufB [Candidatus Bipolaricaulota bacterium]|nr:Fe-S cluster assembly protein SufB [Candidatus Bipolaricaulota bacterium]MCX7844713.1 Fe-S cluster assembly protein SufB [Candidatus Bipolaricaulota bacterium]MDW8152426.1 Fe-S cluster assembly protein SufB [Candidatus Bipolaricaulota bacterium]